MIPLGRGGGGYRYQMVNTPGISPGIQAHLALDGRCTAARGDHGLPLIRAVRQPRDPYSTMSFVPDVEPDQQRGDLLDKARVLKLAAIDRSHARDLCREFHRDLRGVRIVAAYDHVAIHVIIAVAVEHFRRKALER